MEIRHCLDPEAIVKAPGLGRQAPALLAPAGPSALLIAALLLAGGAQFLSARGPEASFTPAAGLEAANFSRRRPPAAVSQRAPLELLTEGYIEIGTLRVAVDGEGSGANLTGRALKEAASRGGDLMVIQKSNAATNETRYRNGKCARAEKVARREKDYKTVCNNPRDLTSCTKEETGWGTWISEYTCVAYEKVPYTATVTETVGQVFRYEPARACGVRAGVAFGEREYAKAVPEYTCYLATNAGDAGAYTLRGTSYSRIGDRAAAIADYNRALAIDPQYAFAYNFRADAYYDTQQYELAIADYTRAIELGGGLDHAIAYKSRGLAYDGAQQYELAIADYTKAIELGSGLAAYESRARAYCERREYGKAVSDYDRVIELNPKSALTYNNRGAAYYGAQQYELAIADYTKAIELGEGLNTYDNRARAYAARGEYGKAIGDYDRVIGLNPKYARAYGEKATACERAGLAAEAIDAYEKYIQYAEPEPDGSNIKAAREKVEALKNRRGR